MREPYATWISLANQRRESASDCEQAEHNVAARIVAVDVPSGMSAQTGLAAQPCIHADATVTMIVYKPGLVKPEAARWTGSMKLAPLVSNAERYIDAL
ncbi:NAD(P)H-hydrate epimerase [uncultured Senegalimassilia sp.]|uniref:NAD(P)H-hydrate epimerase n=1 Tax=uncultured Senegalimassilia sp. TaxID=1714350 RepID=UPI0034A4455B